MPQWTLFRLETPLDQAENAAQILHDAGCTGTQIDDREIVLDDSEDATFVPRDLAIVSGYLDPDADAETARQIIENACAAQQIETALHSEPIDDSDWATNWRENFPPLSIGRFQILPSWEEATPDANLIPLRLDPGLAFGTGQHPTTHLCLELIGQYVPNVVENCSASTCRAFDVGCGSGILSIALAKLGAQVLASDLDEWCVEASEENASENEVEIEVVQATGANWTSEKFDVVVANLMSDLLISLAPQLRARCKPASTCILSGISSQRAEDVKNALFGAGFELIEERERAGETRGDYTESWCALVLRAI